MTLIKSFIFDLDFTISLQLAFENISNERGENLS